LPTYSERIEMLNVHVRGLKINFVGKDRHEFLSQLSHLTPGFSGADLANICNEAALMAARDGKLLIEKSHFYAALERVIAGAEKKNSIITVEDKKLIGLWI
jgi:ATP-dependent Zn protease